MTAAVRWREAGPCDAEAIRDLTRAAYARWVPLIGREPAPMTADHEAAPQTQDDVGIAVVVRMRKRLAG